MVTQALKYLRNYSTPNIETIEPLLSAERADQSRGRFDVCIGGSSLTERLSPLLEDWDKRVQGAAMAALIKYAGLDGVLACATHLKSMLVSPNQDTRVKRMGFRGSRGQQFLPTADTATARLVHSSCIASNRSCRTIEKS